MSRSESMKRYCSDPNIRQQRIEHFQKLWDDPEHRRKMGELSRERWNDPEYKKRVSAAIKKARSTPAAKQQTSEIAKNLWQDPDFREKTITALRDSERMRVYHSDPDERKRRSNRAKNQWSDLDFRNSMTGKGNPNWQGGISYGSYCPKFNFRLKERIRNECNRTCAFCGKSEILNGERLAVHHVDGDKMTGCNGKTWKLIALCRSCHGKLHGDERFEVLGIMNLDRLY